MSLTHDPGCACAICRHNRLHSLVTIQDDRDRLADAWDFWISSRDGESTKLRAGMDGAPGSPRWVALQAIASARIAAVADTAAASADVARARPLSHFAEQAAAINDSDPLMSIYAAPEWAELGDEGKEWVCGLVRETIARVAERPTGIAPAGLPKSDAPAAVPAGVSVDRPVGHLGSGRHPTGTGA